MLCDQTANVEHEVRRKALMTSRGALLFDRLVIEPYVADLEVLELSWCLVS